MLPTTQDTNFSRCILYGVGMQELVNVAITYLVKAIGRVFIFL
jgi:hypothetical protein